MRVSFFIWSLMAEVVKVEEREGVRVLVYDNGLEKNAATGHIMRPADNALITSENARALQRKRQEKRREALLAAMLEGVERKEFIEKFGEDAWIMAIGYSAMIKATTPDDPKAIEAARFLREWYSQLEADPDSPGVGGTSSRLVLLIAELTRRNDSVKVIEPVSVS